MQFKLIYLCQMACWEFYQSARIHLIQWMGYMSGNCNFLNLIEQVKSPSIVMKILQKWCWRLQLEVIELKLERPSLCQQLCIEGVLPTSKSKKKCETWVLHIAQSHRQNLLTMFKKFPLWNRNNIFKDMKVDNEWRRLKLKLKRLWNLLTHRVPCICISFLWKPSIHKWWWMLTLSAYSINSTKDKFFKIYFTLEYSEILMWTDRSPVLHTQHQFRFYSILSCQHSSEWERKNSFFIEKDFYNGIDDQ